MPEYQRNPFHTSCFITVFFFFGIKKNVKFCKVLNLKFTKWKNQINLST